MYEAMDRAGTSALSDMHQKWSEKGAQEFVPGLGIYNAAANANRNGQHVNNRMLDVSGIQMPPMGYMPAQMQSWNMGMMPEGQWSMQSYQPSESPTKPRSYVALWNVSPDYNTQELQKTLNGIDYYPECQEAEAGFLLSLAESHQAASLAISLDGSNELKSTGQICAAVFNPESDQWSKQDVPSSIQQKLSTLLQV
eukprot:CAMPEP_0181417806 /NCGR_PEP_ID=MMETSP1110-20121109/11230_1 /TAXON_ID=174948 /ORGANISM="Symbiodinium sp., Strain CCMP421" /LENGTH=195 /DNA_ID=CAMNT_0023540767 /DNA_START=1 /DNA_END=588 /DNA_ORIENTATION=+